MWLSTAQDPTSFDNFTTSSGQQQIVRGFANTTGTGDFCIPLDLSNTGISGVLNGANVTVQFVYNAGDENLYQVGLRATLPASSYRRLTEIFAFRPVHGPDAVEQLYYPLRYLLQQCLYYLDFGSPDHNRDWQRWRKWSGPVGRCKRSRLLISFDHCLLSRTSIGSCFSR
jgi:hypothetical protein